MATDKPKIAILMAIYDPHMDWLREQLNSLNAQTYPNLQLYIRDDCSPTVPYEDIEKCVAECITNIPYTISRNEQNMGSNLTFQKLTEEAEGDYFAYCDQDDVWLPEKLETLEKQLAEGFTMTYSDVSVIDSQGKEVVKSLLKQRPRLRYVAGKSLAETYFFRNCTAGCAMLIRVDIAKAALPFPKQTVCDQWLAIVAAQEGEISFTDIPLVRYRQHEHNQTGVLYGVEDKKSYRSVRLEPLRERLAFYKKYTEPSQELVRFVEARLQGRISDIWCYRRFSKYEAAFELAMYLLPNFAVKILLRRLK